MNLGQYPDKHTTFHFVDFKALRSSVMMEFLCCMCMLPFKEWYPDLVTVLVECLNIRIIFSTKVGP